MNNDQITALVTGANGGLGKRFAAELIERGAKVYAAARRPETIDTAGVEPIQLDITDPVSVRRAAPRTWPATLPCSSTMRVPQRAHHCCPGRSRTSGWRWRRTTSAR
jgi:nucleoside-diphosphate-sugar epimerase